MSESEFFDDFQEKMDSKAKSPVFAFVRSIFFVLLLKAKYQTKVVDRPKFKRHPHVAKAFRYPKHIYKHVEHHGKLIFLGVKVDKPKST